MRRGSALILLVLLGRAVNFPLAMWLDREKYLLLPFGTRASIDVHGPAATEKRWPSRPPHTNDWPAPERYWECGAPGYRRIEVQAPVFTYGNPAHRMLVERFGWPLPCVQRVQMWWPWEDPAWQTTADPNPKPRVHWPGAIFNPLIVGGALWLVLVALLELSVALRRRVRRGQWRCERCGYPRGYTPQCSECGTAFPELRASP